MAKERMEMNKRVITMSAIRRAAYWTMQTPPHIARGSDG
jgi:hypothetical protein